MTQTHPAVSKTVNQEQQLILIDTLLLWARLWSPLLVRSEFEEYAQQQALAVTVQSGYDSLNQSAS